MQHLERTDSRCQARHHDARSAPFDSRNSNVRIEWTPAMDALLGTDLDRNVAQRLQLSTATVLRRRQALGIMSVKEARGQAVRAIGDAMRKPHFWANISSPFAAFAGAH